MNMYTVYSTEKTEANLHTCQLTAIEARCYVRSAEHTVGVMAGRTDLSFVELRDLRAYASAALNAAKSTADRADAALTAAKAAITQDQE